MKNMRFEDTQDQDLLLQFDKITAVRTVFESFVNNCKKCYNISEYTAIGEVVQCYKSTHKGFSEGTLVDSGCKLFALVDCKTRYISNLDMYISSQSDELFSGNNSISSMVKRLASPIKHTGRIVTIEHKNIISVKLADDLLKDRIKLIGPISVESRQVPPEFILTTNRKPNSSLFGYLDSKTLVSYKADNSNAILLLSTVRQYQRNDPKTIEVPEIIQFYNSIKTAVEAMDAMAHYHTTARSCVEWPNTIFFTMLDIGGINAGVIHVANTRKKNSRLFFTNALGRELINDQLKRRYMMDHLPIAIQLRLEHYCGACNLVGKNTYEKRLKDKAERSKRAEQMLRDAAAGGSSQGENAVQVTENTAETEEVAGEDVKNEKKNN